MIFFRKVVHTAYIQQMLNKFWFIVCDARAAGRIGEGSVSFPRGKSRSVQQYTVDWCGGGRVSSFACLFKSRITSIDATAEAKT